MATLRVLLAAALVTLALFCMPVSTGAAGESTSPFKSALLPGIPSGLVVLNDHVALVSADDQLYRSSDGGASWQPVYAHCAQEQMVGAPCGYALHFARLAGGTVLAAEPGSSLERASPSVWRSEDGGRSWQRATLPAAVLQGPEAVGGDGYLLLQPETGASGAVLERSGDDNSWSAVATIPLRDPATPARGWSLGALSVLGPKAFLAGYGAGGCSLPSGLALSRDGGVHWQALTPPLYGSQAAPTADGPDRWFLAGSCQASAPVLAQGLFATTDGGSSWQPARLQAGQGPLRPAQITFSSSPGKRLTGSGDVLDLGAIAFADATSGVAVGGYRRYDASNGSSTSANLGALVLTTSDAGAIWTLSSLPGLPALDLVSCTGPSACLAASTSSRTLVVFEQPARPAGEVLIFNPAIPLPPTARPARIQLDNHDFLEHLRWLGWGGATARAYGTLLLDTCARSCAGGPFRAYAVAVVGSDVQHCTVEVIHGATLRPLSASFYNQVAYRYIGKPPASRLPQSLEQPCRRSS